MDAELEQLLTSRTTNTQSLRQLAVDTIREAIVMGYYKPGEALRERQLSEKMNISTTPLKEAFRTLEYEGLVVTVPRKGTFVSNMADTKVEEVLMLRASVEGLCARLAAEKMTENEQEHMKQQLHRMDDMKKEHRVKELVEENTLFHQMVVTYARSPMLEQTWNTVAAFDRAFRKLALQQDKEQDEGLLEHWRIFQAMENRDGETAEQEMRNHILRTMDQVMKQEQRKGE
ncbi:GntR family transcriptional regulator [Salibacterium halotolerans]|uniref:DNA-binding transcriptional regulator, GntR family n=1 Tax=Salibacterium halotolerans TaxID=1884432 RepID=A0A1I5LGK9_9BACI|nr:GntR family transcriptional regulator [Salibacterium halotolerans]SFO95851.1 DNA-binding transcriptional regulator, GntR family [Salibacterium halotolerans]